MSSSSIPSGQAFQNTSHRTTPSSSVATSPTLTMEETLPSKGGYKLNSGVPIQLEAPNSTTQKPGVRFSNRGPPLTKLDGSETSATHANRGGDPSLNPVDSKWGELFDNEGGPTNRLRSVFRGLAAYLIEEVAPQRSLVVTPSKMRYLYLSNSIDNELHDYAGRFSRRAKLK